MGPILIVIILLGIAVIGIGAYLFIRQRQSQSVADLPPPDIGELVDYTSQPIEEPKTWRDRLNEMPRPTLILLALIPLLLLGAITIAVLMMFLGGGSQQEASGPPSVEIGRARMVSEDAISVQADVNLPEGTPVNIELLAGEESLAWFNSGDAQTEVSNGQIDVRLNRADDPQLATPGDPLTVLVTAEANGERIENSSELNLGPFAGAIFDEADDTPTPEPTAEPEPTEATVANDPTPTLPPATPEPPTPSLGGQPFVVGNGGNMRAQPSESAPIVGGVIIGETVNVLYKAPDDTWFWIVNDQGISGWSHNAVLLLSPDDIAQVPLQSDVSSDG